MVKQFNVTYETWDDESIEAGETDDRGYACENETLRDAIRELMASSATADIQSIETNRWPDNGASTYVTVCNGLDWDSGETTNKSLHRPTGITNASWSRIVRLIKG